MDQTRKLYRSRSNRQVAGVCGGLAQYFNLGDPSRPLVSSSLARRSSAGRADS